MTAIHPTAVIEPGAKIGENCSIGAFCVIGAEVELGDESILHSHVVVTGRTTLGKGNQIFPFASIGHQPQDLKYKGEASRLQIGDGNVIREHVTMNPGTEGGGMVTSVGQQGLFMMGAHVAHDCSIGDHVIMANNATLAGHVVVEDGAIIGGLAAVHQFVRIGRSAMIGGMSGVEHDVIPYGMVMGERARLQGLNIVGMKRQGMGRQEIRQMQAAYDALFASEGTMAARVEKMAQDLGAAAEVQIILKFLRQESSRAILQP